MTLINIKMSHKCIVSRAFILVTDAKVKDSHVMDCNTVVKSPQKKPKFTCFFTRINPFTPKGSPFDE